MTTYRVPRPARSGAVSAGGSLSVEWWLFGLAASCDEWPPDRYEFQLSDMGRPVLVDHTELRAVSSGMADARVGAVRRFAWADDIGVIVLMEITSPSVLWDVAEGRRNGLSIHAHMGEPPVGDREWVWISEVSLTATPKRPAGAGRLHRAPRLA